MMNYVAENARDEIVIEYLLAEVEQFIVIGSYHNALRCPCQAEMTLYRIYRLV